MPTRRALATMVRTSGARPRNGSQSFRRAIERRTDRAGPRRRATSRRCCCRDRSSSGHRHACAARHDRSSTTAVAAAERRLAGPLRMRHQADDVAAPLQMPAMLSSEPFGLAASVVSPPAVDVAEDHLAVLLELARSRRARRSSCLRRARSAGAAPGPAAHSRRERRVGLLDADVHVLAEELAAIRLRSIAPGSRPASSRTWKPLQMPSTGPPRSANASTAAMIGEKRAIAPVRR